jgi:peptidoglycan/LPS O-acetylase OafA/YrhL
MAFCLLFRIAIGWNHSYDVTTMYNPTHVRIDGLFFGVLLAYVYHYHPEAIARAARYRLPLIFGGMMLVLPQFVLVLEEKRFVWTFGYTLLYLGYGSILIGIMSSMQTDSKLNSFFRSAPARFIAWIGTYSYSIYLWHLFVVFQLNDLWSGPALASFSPLKKWLLVTALLLVGSVAIGVLLGKLVEIPALALRDRLFPRRAAALEQA